MDDLISRQAAIDAIKELCEHYTPTKSVTHPHMDFVIEELQNLPSAQPERKKGKWIDEPVYKQTMDGKTWDGYTYCSECREMHEYGYRSKYCPNCGAEMRGEEE